MIDGHGDDSRRYGGKVRLDFSSNIYPKARLDDLKRHLASRLDLIESYPEPEPLSLERALARENGIDPGEVMVTDGATEAIYMIARSLGVGRRGEPVANVVAGPTFSEYADACAACGALVVGENDETTLRTTRWICNPNNPTGSADDARLLLERVDARPNDLFVIDQSYEQYTLTPMITDAEAVCRHNVILVHSMTKRFCVPGLRLGYVTASADLTRRLKSERHPWSVNALAAEAGLYLVSTGYKAIPDVEAYLREAQRLRSELAAIEGIEVEPTATNFMLARVKGMTAAELKSRLVDEWGVLIRDASNFRGLDDTYFRVAARDREDDNALIEAVRSVLSGVRD